VKHEKKISALDCTYKFVLFATFLSLTATRAQAAQTVVEVFEFRCDSTGKVCPSGGIPGPIIESADGNFYGATSMGGTGNQAAGTVFKLTPFGQVMTLFTFSADATGKYPNGANPTGVIEGNDGSLYGSTVAGGINNTGLVFKLSKTGAFHVLHVGGVSSLTLGADGNLYGYGADTSGNTSVARISPSGSYQVLHTLNPKTDGIYPAGLVLASDGNLYGTTIDAEVERITSLFRLTPSGQFTVLQTIHYGQFLVSAPIQAASGQLYAGLDFVVNSDGTLPPGLLEAETSGSSRRLIPLSYGVLQWMQQVMEASDGTLWGTSSEIGQGGGIVSFTHAGAPLEEINFGGYGLMQASDGRILGLCGNEIFALVPALPAPKPLFVRSTTLSGAVGSTVMIQGAHLLGMTRVTFNGVSAAFKVLNAGNIAATIPAGATTGLIEVTNAGGTAASMESFTIK
jgi:uncharacterized repeat protein (TIGR03803 family)